MIEMKVDGLDSVAFALKELGPRIARNALKSAVMAGAAPIAKDAQARAPVQTGTLRAAIYRKALGRLSNTSRQVVIVGVRQGRAARNVKRGKKTRNLDAYYWRWVEFGHVVVPRGSSNLATRRRFASKGRGQQVAARPFMRPAFESNKVGSISIIKQRLLQYIEQERQKLAKK